ncbi:MAG: PIN domain-containing protein [Thaumarchaeota archaeon]|nr:MAG: PIN domain-containing protein [Nitrososphaerota archaeon]
MRVSLFSRHEARSLLRDVQTGKLEATSSALTFDELVWAVKRNRTSEDAIASGEAFLNMPRLRLVDVDGNILARALALMRKYRLDPRDSIHAASALTEGAELIISTDKHFDKIREIRRRGISGK